MGQALIALVVAFVVGSTGMAGQYLAANQTGKQTRLAKIQDWERADRIAATAAEVAAQTAAAAIREAAVVAATAVREAAVVATTTADRVIDATKVTNAAIREVHTIINSDRTAGMERTLTALRATLAALSEVARLSADPSDETRASILATQREIDQLTRDIADRHRQTKLAEAAVETVPSVVTWQEQPTQGET